MTIPSESYTQVSSSGTRSCALRSNGDIFCWGLGLPDRSCLSLDDGGVVCEDWNVDWTNPPAGPYTNVDCGYSGRTCAVKRRGELLCGQSESDANDEEEPPAGSYVQVSVGLEQSCALKTDGSIACWGDYYGSVNDTSSPVAPSTSPPGSSYVQVSTGDNVACAVKSDANPTKIQS